MTSIIAIPIFAFLQILKERSTLKEASLIAARSSNYQLPLSVSWASVNFKSHVHTLGRLEVQSQETPKISHKCQDISVNWFEINFSASFLRRHRPLWSARAAAAATWIQTGPPIPNRSATCSNPSGWTRRTAESKSLDRERNSEGEDWGSQQSVSARVDGVVWCHPSSGAP